MLLGTGLPGGRGGAVAAWRSTDLRTWGYDGLVLTMPPGGPVETGPVWECPQLVEVDGRWVLLVSVQLPDRDEVTCSHVQWFVGDFDGTSFAVADSGVLDVGDCFYATAVAQGTERCLVWGWLQESPALRRTGPADFSGALSLPRELYLDRGRPCLRPAAELDHAWGEPVPTGQGLAPHYRLVVDVDADGEADAVLGADGSGKAVRLTVVPARLTAGGFLVDLPPGPVHVEVFVDSSVVEVFAHGRAISFRVDPELDCSNGVVLRGSAVHRALVQPFREP
jgi:beta-fructofuranosidase